MDPGYKYLQQIKTVPNLVSEEPSTITPKNTSFVDVPWSDFTKLLAQKRESINAQCRQSQQLLDEHNNPPEKDTVEDFNLGNWDACTGYQDKSSNKK
jgi:hypothetical protein